MLQTKQKKVVRISDVVAEPVEWLWPGMLASGTLALLDGDPDQGKSLLSLDLAARLSRGRPWPDGRVGAMPSGVVLLGCEDDLESTVRPRLEALDADLDRIVCFAGITADGTARLPRFPDDCDLLAETIREAEARLVVIDPFLAFLNQGVACVSDQLVRRALQPLAEVAARTRATCLLVRHLTKGGRGQRALCRGAGAMALIGSARTAFLVGRPDDQADQRLLACTKNNLAEPPATLAFHIAPGPTGLPAVHWDGPVSLRADDIVVKPAAEPGPAMAEAIHFLREVLRLGPTTRDTVLRQSRARSIADSTIERARRDLEILSEVKVEEGRRIAYWSLPVDEDSERIMRELFGREAVGKKEAGEEDKRPA